MANEHDATDLNVEGDNPDPTSEEQDAQLGQLLADKFGKDFTLDDLNGYRSDREAWNRQQNRHNMEAADARKEAEEARDNLLTTLATAPTQAPNSQEAAGRALSEVEFFQTLGVTDAEEQLNARQAYAMFKGMSDYALAANKVYGEKFAEAEGSIGTMQEEFEQTSEALAQYLTDERIGELQTEFPHADRESIVAAIRDAPQGDTFDSFVEDAARSSHEHILNVGQQAVKTEQTRRTEARKNRFTGSGAAAGAAGRKMPSLNTNEGIAAFIEANPMGGGDEPY